MFKCFLKDLWYAHATEDTKEIRFQLEFYYQIIFRLSRWYAAILTYAICLIVILGRKSEAMVIGATVTEIIILVIYLLLGFKRMQEIGEFLALKIYFRLITQRGKAITREDFKYLKENEKCVYDIISEQECRGFCYAVCFNLCKRLKKGKIELLAVREFCYENESKIKWSQYTMHTLFVNNGWVFDTYSVRQYPAKMFYEIEEAKIYRSFEYDEIKDKSYEQFVIEEVDEIQKWAEANDCDCGLKEYIKKS